MRPPRARRFSGRIFGDRCAAAWRVVVLVALAAVPGRAGLEAGFAAADLTPEKPVPLAGYGDRQSPEKLSDGVHDRIMAKAAVFRRDGVTAAFVATDLCLIHRSLHAAVAARLDPALGVSADGLMIGGNHTHNGPGGLIPAEGITGLFGRMGAGRYEEAEFTRMAAAIADAVARAIADLRPARLAFTTAREERLTHNRGWDDGPIDPEVGIMTVAGADGRVRGLLVNFAIHGTCLPVADLHLSGDVGGAIWRAVEARFPGATCLFFNGAEGDIRPAAPDGTSGLARCARLGELLAETVVRATAAPTWHDDLPLAVHAWDATLPRGEGLLGLLMRGAVKDTRLRMIAFGREAAFAAVPGEMTCESGARVKALIREAGYPQAFLLGLTNDHLAYLVHPEAYQPEHEAHWRYEKSMNPFGAGAEPFFLREFRQGLAALAATPRAATPRVPAGGTGEEF